MEIQLNIIGGSPSSSSSDPNPNSNHNRDPMHTWWEAMSKARERINALSSIISSSSSSISSLADSDTPARSLLQSSEAYEALSSALFDPLSGSGGDPLCEWLYVTFQSSDPDLRLVVLSVIPLIAGLYLSRVASSVTQNPIPSLAGFEAVLLSLYVSETKSRAGKPILVAIPDLSQPSLYHAPRTKPAHRSVPSKPSVGVLCPALEPQDAVKSTKRNLIVGVALDCYYKQISQMPSWSKLELCQFAAAWAGQNCPCANEFDKNSDGNEISSEDSILVENEDILDSVEEMKKLGMGEEDNETGITKGARILLPWELLQPLLRIIGHCLLAPLNSEDVRDAASVAVRRLYARASHELVTQAILATRSLIQLDNRARLAAKEAASASAASNANTPSKAKKPEILLVSK